MATGEPTPLRLVLDQLIHLQEIDTERDRASRARAHLDTGAALQAKAAAAHAAADRIKSDLSQAQGLLKDAELEQSGVESKIKSYEQRQRSGQVTTAREVSNIEREIGQLIRRRGALDDKLLALMDQVESGRAQLLHAENIARQAEQDATTQIQAYRAHLAKLDAELSRLETERSGSVSCVDNPTLLQRYESIRTRPASAGVAVSRIVERHCSGCGNQVSANDSDKVREALQLVICESCGRILAVVQ